MIHASLANNTYALRPYAMSGLAFFTSLPLIYIAWILATGTFKDLSWFVFIILTLDYLISIDIALENLLGSILLRLFSILVIRVLQLSIVDSLLC